MEALLHGIVLIYIAIVIVGVGIALWMPKRKSIKVAAAAATLAVLVGPLAYSAWIDYRRSSEARAKLDSVEAVFVERCKLAGVKIYRTAQDVSGVLLMKIRPNEINYGEQFALTDPYGADYGGDAYIMSFLRGFDSPRPEPPRRLGYLYVEAIDPKDGQRYRYTGAMQAVGRMDATAPNVRIDLERNPNLDLNIYKYQLSKVSAPADPPRYGVTYDDISTQADRDIWIAGGSLKVIDLQTNEVMAERVGYMMDPGQGSRGGGRSPWLLAADHACPVFAPRHGATAQDHQSADFTEAVLEPRTEN